MQYSKKLFYLEINPLKEFFVKNPLNEIENWIQERGNAQHKTELEIVSYFTDKRQM